MRFISDIKPATGQIYMGLHTEEIVGYSTAVVTIDHPKGKRQIQFLETAFILDFYTNLMSLKKLNKKGIYWNNKENIQYYGNKVTYTHCSYHCDQSTLKYNKPKEDLIEASFVTQSPIKHSLKPL